MKSSIRITKTKRGGVRVYATGKAADTLFRMMVIEPPSKPSFVPLPEGVVRYNGGTRCDMEYGPCSCGATHDPQRDPAKEGAP